jgi:polyprenyl-phospho-N-acetylgalactosaminyl synthase
MMKTLDTAKRIWVVVPAYNEAAAVAAVLEDLLSGGLHVVVVDDCSSDETYQICRRCAVDLLRHPVNLGYGAALQTGIEWALRQGAEIVVTFDADGQHLAAEVPGLVQPLLDGRADVALGSRFLGVAADDMPRRKRALLRLAVAFTRLNTGLKLSDTHNGMRAFSRSAAKQMHLSQSGMAYASEFLSWLAAARLRWVEVPVRVRYTPYSKEKGQSIMNSINILWEMIFK